MIDTIALITVCVAALLGLRAPTGMHLLQRSGASAGYAYVNRELASIDSAYSGTSTGGPRMSPMPMLMQAHTSLDDLIARFDLWMVRNS